MLRNDNFGHKVEQTQLETLQLDDGQSEIHLHCSQIFKNNSLFLIG